MVTVRDVAREARVSVGTVSKVLSKDPTVKIALRDRVVTAVEQLGYRPNMAARALRTNKLNMLGLVVPDITNPFFAQLAKAIEAEAAKQLHTVMLTNSDDDKRVEARQIETLLEQSPRGLIVVGSANPSGAPIATEVPIISVDRRYGTYDLIATDHESGSALIAEHLYNLGHRRIAYISGPKSTEVGHLREKGFREQLLRMSESGDPIDLQTIEGHFDYISGEEIARELLSVETANRPTAIAAASDQQAIGALRKARDLGISVPTELSVAGFDDITLADLVVPRLTSVSQQTDRMAQLAVHRLLSVEPHSVGDELVEPLLCPRGSTGITYKAG